MHALLEQILNGSFSSREIAFTGTGTYFRVSETTKVEFLHRLPSVWNVEEMMREFLKSKLSLLKTLAACGCYLANLLQCCLFPV